MVVGEKIVICLVRLYGSPTVVMWSIGMCNGRAKTSMGSEDYRGWPLSGDCDQFGRYLC